MNFLCLFALMVVSTIPFTQADDYIVTVGGGIVSGQGTNAAEAFDAKSGNRVALPNLPNVNVGVTMAAASGYIYAIAGWATPDGVLQYVPGTGSWISSNKLPVAKDQGATAVTIDDDVYVVGGDSDTNGLAILRQDNPNWQIGPNSTLPHYYSGGAAHENSFYVCGSSLSHSFHPSAACERFDTKIYQWVTVVPMNTPRGDFAMAALNGFIYAIGGASGRNEGYNVKTESWSYVANMTVTRFVHAAASDGIKIYALGGAAVHDQSPYYDSIESYNVTMDSWHLEKIELSSPRQQLSAVFVPNVAQLSTVEENETSPTANRKTANRSRQPPVDSSSARVKQT